MDGKIINLGINYTIVANPKSNKFDVLAAVANTLAADTFAIYPDMGESFDISKMYSAINSVAGVVDTVDVEVVLKTGGIYSDVYYDIPANISPDGRLLQLPEDYIWEVKSPFTDIKGSVQ